ncbi:hypothetical protein SETIT_4G195800v2 [Setaria italica]|uniref:J domain-containing protein n=1 Tax=Setaria italica TaxID=4555 RepID=A0A368QW20_SETIT|nr:chaperone protein dnaJ 8, chloroplastic [Setaria italica]RCV22129.1 hypothetical protein SETIT_4G195800v2 [Setaria italica]
MAVAGGVRVASSVEVWGRRRSSSTSTSSAARRGAAAATVRCSCVGEAGPAAGGLAEEHYRTLRLRPGATRGEVKKAFRRLALMYHPDVCKESDGGGGRDACGVQFQRISVAYQMLMSNMREAEERLEYWRLKYGLTDQDLDRYRSYLNEDDDDWFDV